MATVKSLNFCVLRGQELVDTAICSLIRKCAVIGLRGCRNDLRNVVGGCRCSGWLSCGCRGLRNSEEAGRNPHKGISPVVLAVFDCPTRYAMLDRLPRHTKSFGGSGDS